MTQLTQFRAKASLLACALALGAWQLPANATSFQQAYQAAVDYDAKFQSARFERDANAQVVPLARAQLLPTLSASVSDIKYQGYRSIPTPSGEAVRQDLDYKSPQQSLNLRFGLYNPEALRRFSQAKKQAAYGEVALGSRELELVDRFGAAYFQVLLSAEEMRLIEAQVVSLQEQAKSASRRFAGGEGTRTEIAETQARLETAMAQRIDTASALEVAKLSFKTISGLNAEDLDELQPAFAPPTLAPANLDDWLQLALDRNSNIVARKLAVQIAEDEVSKSRAGHLPKLDLVAGVSRSKSESVNVINQTLSQRSFGLVLNVPIYSGGYVNALTEQALANVQRAKADLDAEVAATQISIRRAFLASSNGLARTKAYELALASSRVALDGARRGLAAGLRTNADVLDAQKQVFTTLRDLAQTRYEFLLSKLRLSSAAGAKPQQIVDEISVLLAPRR
jgi:outer membrane protein, protease secretion system